MLLFSKVDYRSEISRGANAGVTVDDDWQRIGDQDRVCCVTYARRQHCFTTTWAWVACVNSSQTSSIPLSTDTISSKDTENKTGALITYATADAFGRNIHSMLQLLSKDIFPAVNGDASQLPVVYPFFGRDSSWKGREGPSSSGWHRGWTVNFSVEGDGGLVALGLTAVPPVDCQQSD